MPSRKTHGRQNSVVSLSIRPTRTTACSSSVRGLREEQYAANQRDSVVVGPVRGGYCRPGSADNTAGADHDDVVALVASRISDDIIVLAIEAGTTTFDLSESALSRLKAGGVSANVLAAMRRVTAQ